ATAILPARASGFLPGILQHTSWIANKRCGIDIPDNIKIKVLEYINSEELGKLIRIHFQFVMVAQQHP
ncbi:MAG: hypothetical protein ACOC7W_01705, partial [Desulfosalsimonas sp.]